MSRYYWNIMFRRWMNHRRYWNTFGILSWKSTAWTPSGGRGCWRRCPGCGSTRTRRSRTSSGSGSPSPAGWTSTTIPSTRRLASSKLEAVSYKYCTDHKVVSNTRSHTIIFPFFPSTSMSECELCMLGILDITYNVTTAALYKMKC